jgi:hypothetical protein
LCSAGQCIKPVVVDAGDLDAGTGQDAAAAPDAGPTLDAGIPPDGGPALDAGPTSDAATPMDAGEAAESGTSAWWNGIWTRRWPILITGHAEQTLQDAPILMAVPCGTRPELQCQADPPDQDWRFIDESGASLPFEVEVWAPNAMSLFWIKVPTLNPGPNGTRIWLYGAPAQASTTGQVPSEQTWSAGYQGVYHLGNTDDSSALGNDGTPDQVAVVPGRIGDGIDFHDESQPDGGVFGCVNLRQNQPLLRNATGATLSAWIYSELAAWPDNTQYLVSISIGAISPTKETRFNLLVDIDGEPGSRMRIQDDQGNTYHDAQTPLPEDRWVHLAVVLEDLGDTIIHRIFQDGQVIHAREYGPDGGLGPFPFSDTNSFNASLGCEDDGSEPGLHGKLDEVRISNIPRSQAWLLVQVENQDDPSGTVALGPMEER